MNTRMEATESSPENFELMPREYNSQQFFVAPATIKLYQSNRFSFVTLLKHSLPAILAGIGTLCLKAYLPLMLSCAVPPLTLTLLTIAAAALIAYGVFQGLNYANIETYEDDFVEDVEPSTPRVATW